MIYTNHRLNIYRSLLMAVITCLLMSLPVRGAANDDACKECHSDIVQKWSRSHHAGAMQPAGPKTILGDFSDISLNHHGQTAFFSKKNGRYQVTMKDKGQPEQRFDIRYSFGITPLQQYLVATEDGRYQVLPFAWDSRPKMDGGQRWFHIYPEEYLPPGDRLHWQQPLQNWNGMCADCHSTGLKRDYDVEENRFNTRFDNVNISCASCHGDTPEHTAKWGEDKPKPQDNMQICMACHSRREVLSDGIDPAVDFLDQFSPSLLDDNLYFADGQIQDEVYVWGSFLQSKMYQNDVTCTDCHDSHSLELKRSGNDLCTQCHVDELDSPAHHHHDKSSKGAQCVSCHMPERTYMVIDKRRDHSFKIPRPDHSDHLGSPNACISCHNEKDNSWATDRLIDWFPDSQHRGNEPRTIHDARRGDPAARAGLLNIIMDETQPAITRATALGLIPRLADTALVQAAGKLRRHKEPLIRLGATRALAVLPPDARLELLSPLLRDKVKAVRIEAARQLLDSPNAHIIEKAFAELKEANQQAAWRGEGRVNLAVSYEFSGITAAAEKQYRAALHIDPAFSPALINLSELLRRTGRNEEAFTLLQMASRKKAPDPAITHAYGLALVRSGDAQKGADALEKAQNNAPDIARYGYVYLVALNSLGQTEDAYIGLKAALKNHPYDTDLLNFALSLALKRQDSGFARNLLSTLLKIDPSNRQYQQLLARIG